MVSLLKVRVIDPLVAGCLVALLASPVFLLCVFLLPLVSSVFQSHIAARLVVALLITVGVVAGAVAYLMHLPRPVGPVGRPELVCSFCKQSLVSPAWTRVSSASGRGLPPVLTRDELGLDSHFPGFNEWICGECVGVALSAVSRGGKGKGLEQRVRCSFCARTWAAHDAYARESVGVCGNCLRDFEYRLRRQPVQAK